MLWVVYNIKSNLINSIHETKEAAVNVRKNIEDIHCYIVVPFDPDTENIAKLCVIGKPWIFI